MEKQSSVNCVTLFVEPVMDLKLTTVALVKDKTKN